MKKHTNQRIEYLDNITCIQMWDAVNSTEKSDVQHQLSIIQFIRYTSKNLFYEIKNFHFFFVSSFHILTSLCIENRSPIFNTNKNSEKFSIQRSFISVEWERNKIKKNCIFFLQMGYIDCNQSLYVYLLN